MSSSPPPFQVPPVPQARATNSANKTCLIIVLMVVGLIIVFCGFLSFMIKNVVSQVSSTASCAVMFELSQKAALAYSEEHGGRLPDAAKWEEELSPYYGRLYAKLSTEMKGTPIVENFLPPAPGQDLQCKWDQRVTGIAMNQDLGGKKVSDVKSPTTTVMFFESDRTGKNLAMKYAPMPKSTAPKLMNEQRDWIVYYVDGNSNPLSSSSSSSKSFDITTEDARTPGSEKSSPTKKEE